jgi:hypothetical protein
MAKLPLFINTPIRRYDDTEWHYYMSIYQLTGPPSIMLVLPGDKCDVARSDGISMAKGIMPLDNRPPWPRTLVIPEPPPEVTVQVDSDIMPRQTAKQSYDILKEDFAAGWDVVAAPTVHSESLVVMAWNKEGKLYGDRVTAVDKVAFGFVGFSPKFIEEVEPLYVEGLELSNSVPHDMYCYFDKNEDDSTTFSKLVTDQGFKLGVDPRLLVTHRRGFELDMWSAQLVKSWQKAVEYRLVGPYAEDNSFLNKIAEMVKDGAAKRIGASAATADQAKPPGHAEGVVRRLGRPQEDGSPKGSGSRRKNQGGGTPARKAGDEHQDVDETHPSVAG